MVFSKDGSEGDKNGKGDTRALSGVMIDDGNRSHQSIALPNSEQGTIKQRSGGV